MINIKSGLCFLMSFLMCLFALSLLAPLTFQEIRDKLIVVVGVLSINKQRKRDIEHLGLTGMLVLRVVPHSENLVVLHEHHRVATIFLLCFFHGVQRLHH